MDLIKYLKRQFTQDELDIIDTQASLLISQKRKEIDNARRDFGDLNKKSELEVYPRTPEFYKNDYHPLD